MERREIERKKGRIREKESVKRRERKGKEKHEKEWRMIGTENEKGK